MKFKKINGLIAATFTPFCENGSLDERKIPILARSLSANRMAGVFIAGTTGEGAAMTHDEKITLFEAWAPFSSPEFKVMAMLGGTNQKEAVSLAKKAHELGLYGIALTAPYYMRPNSVKQLVDYYEPIAAAAPGQAFYFYHIPLLSKVELPMVDFLEEAGRRIPNFAGIKYTHNDLMEFNKCLRYQAGKYDILWGWDETMLAGLSMGAKGAVGSTYNYAGPLYQNLIEAFQKQDMEAARHWQEKSIDLISLFAHYGGAACGKAIMKLCGLDCGQFRYPVQQLDKNDYMKLEKDLDQQGFFQWSSHAKQGQ
ncbi:dihydrodipicolinate synthetase [Echinicola strongylocentroti]|uniref:Dihydrodipicolinate synthetase n=1 Tax=Echinicola strongylocentroti TaxID=1795355 RepID=A0A2Z4IG96_9BACT|nr:dihydrodipicolinate synthase family protein [Echinicola strongylocentroti]AWW29508.1 dihydrodipicolinate synthetase [Echinicola strongylocentroti]